VSEDGTTGFRDLKLEYVPDEFCVELKSLKLYIWSFRDRGAFHEAVTNEIWQDLVAATATALYAPFGRFQCARGHLHDVVVAEHRQPGWAAAAPIALP
jgi:7-cyano-7-deazaguanine reductase